MNLIKLSIFFLPLITLLSSSLAMATFLPYTYVDSALKMKQQQGKLPQYPKVNNTKYAADRFTKEVVRGVEIQWYKEIASDFHKIRAQEKIENVDIKNFCEMHERFQLENLQSSDDSCQSLKTEVQQKLRKADLYCDYLNKPQTILTEKFKEKYPEFISKMGTKEKINRHKLKLKDITDLLEIAGVQMLHSSFPPYLHDLEFQTNWREVIHRLYYHDIKKIGEDLKSFYQNSINEYESCYGNRDLRILSEEIQSSLDYIYENYETGLSQATQDKQTILDQNLCRADLKHPELTDDDRRFLSMYIGGVFWRFRGGGGWNLGGTQKNRRYYNRIPLEIIGTLAGAEDGKNIGYAIHSRIFKGWGEWFDMGTSAGDPFEDLHGMTVRGLFQIGEKSSFMHPSNIGALSQTKKRGYDPSYMQVGGAQMGVCYWYMWEYLQHQVRASPEINFAYGATEWGEYCAGAAISIGLVDTLLNGYSCNRADPDEESEFFDDGQ